MDKKRKVMAAIAVTAIAVVFVVVILAYGQIADEVESRRAAQDTAAALATKGFGYNRDLLHGYYDECKRLHV